MPLEFFDTHAHLDADAFATDVDDVVAAAAQAGVRHILTIGIDLATSRSAVELAQRLPGVYAVVGIQPNYAAEMKPGDFDQIVSLLQQPRVVGIGETGLDRYWDHAPIEVQAELFDLHLDLAAKTGLPFVVHCREAEADVVGQLRNAFERHGQLRGVMHSFCGDQRTADACLEMGMHISFAGMLTYRRNEELRAVAKTIPLDRLLIETDAPYLAPQPRRGKRNEPAFVTMTAECLAEVHALPLDQIAAATTENAKRLFLPS